MPDALPTSVCHAMHSSSQSSCESKGRMSSRPVDVSTRPFPFVSAQPVPRTFETDGCPPKLRFPTTTSPQKFTLVRDGFSAACSSPPPYPKPYPPASSEG